MIGAFFMATDMVTSPMTRRGCLLFGAGIGIITCVIRIWGGFPEGMSFAIVIMNAGAADRPLLFQTSVRMDTRFRRCKMSAPKKISIVYLAFFLCVICSVATAALAFVAYTTAAPIA